MIFTWACVSCLLHSQVYEWSQWNKKCRVTGPSQVQVSQMHMKEEFGSISLASVFRDGALALQNQACQNHNSTSTPSMLNRKKWLNYKLHCSKSFVTCHKFFDFRHFQLNRPHSLLSMTGYHYTVYIYSAPLSRLNSVGFKWEVKYEEFGRNGFL